MLSCRAICDAELRRRPPRKYGAGRIDLGRRGSHRKGWTTDRFELYGAMTTVTYKTFLATYRPAGGLIRVVIVRDNADGSWTAFFSTDPDLPVRVILECVADRSAIEQNFHDVKEVEGAGQQQLRNRAIAPSSGLKRGDHASEFL